MYIEAKETARLYKLLSDKLGSDTTEAMFKYIDNKTERSVETTIKTLATKDDLINLRKNFGDDITKLRKDMGDGFANLRKDMGDNIANLHKEIGEGKADTIKWMFIFWIGQVAALLGIIFLFMKK